MASFKGISVDLSTSRDSPQPALLKDAVIGSKGVAVPGSAAYLLPDFSTLKPQELILTVALEPNGSHAPYLKPRREAPTFDDYFKLSPHFSHHAHWDECIKIKFKFFYSILSSPSSADDLTRRMLRSDELLVEERDDKIRSSYHFDLLGLLELGERLKDEKCLDSTTLDLVIMTGGKDGNDIVRAKFKLILKKRQETEDTKESMDRSDIVSRIGFGFLYFFNGRIGDG